MSYFWTYYVTYKKGSGDRQAKTREEKKPEPEEQRTCHSISTALMQVHVVLHVL
jgi:hypothetical protein